MLIRETALIIVHQVLTLLKITVKPALIPMPGETKIRSFRRETGTSEEAGCLELFDLSRTIKCGVRNLFYDDAADERSHIWLSFPLMGRTFFRSADSLRLCCAMTVSQFEAMASPCLAQRKKSAA
jgi:hypothetical protein